MALDRNAILAGRGKFKTQTVSVPEWGGDVVVREMTAGSRDAFEAMAQDARSGKLNAKDFRARLLLATVCDETGKLIFGPEDVAAVSELPSLAVTKVFEAAVHLNGLAKADVDAAEKNSGSGPAAASCTI